eukprot:4313308-Prymnesium_polylepis.1
MAPRPSEPLCNARVLRVPPTTKRQLARSTAAQPSVRDRGGLAATCVQRTTIAVFPQAAPPG